MRRSQLSIIVLVTAAVLSDFAAAAPKDAPAAGGRGGGVADPKAGKNDRAPVLTLEAALARATAYYESGEYKGCAESFAALLDDASQASLMAPRSREQARVYRAACLIAKGELAAADEQFRLAIRENPQMAVPNAIVFPTTVLERFIIVRAGLMEEIRKADEERVQRDEAQAAEARRRAEAERQRVAMLERLAAQETIIVKNQRWVASVPFGVGQFQNRDTALGAVFLASELIAAGTAITATSIELSLHSQADGGRGVTDQGQLDELNDRLKAAHYTGLIASGVFLLTAIGGVVEAHLSFVPEYREGVRKRVSSPEALKPSVTPLLGALPGAAHLGIFGRF
jgi:tetratricopeptide (TPR) repeat protein